MFQIIEKLGMPSPLIHMISLLFQDAYVFEFSRLHMNFKFLILCSSSMHSLTRFIYEPFIFDGTLFSNFCKFNKRRKLVGM